MGKSELAALKAALRSGELARCYIFYGEEAYLREYYLRQLRALVCDAPAGEFNYHKLEARSITVQQVSDAVEAMPMMQERTLVELDDFDLYKASERDQWISLLSDLPDYCTLLLHYDTIAWKPDRRIKKLTDAITKNAVVVEFARQETRELITWTRRRLLALHNQIGDAAAEYLFFRAGGDMTTLAMECEKLAAYTAGEEITQREIDAVTEPVLEAQVFAIVDALAAHRQEEALRRLHDLLTLQEEPIPILAAMGSQLRRLYAACVLRGSRTAVKDLQELYKLQSYPARMSIEAASRLTVEWCARAVTLCEQTDYRLKTSYDDAGRLLELMLLEMML